MNGKKIRKLLAGNMKAARERLNFTQADLAEKAGTSTSFIGEIEICRKFPSPVNLEKIAYALGMKPYQLFYEKIDNDSESDKQIILANIRKDLKQILIDNIDEIIMKYMIE